LNESKVIDPKILMQGICLELRDFIETEAFKELDEDTREAIEDLNFRAEQIETDLP
jgi:hypothetical protein